MGAVIGSRRCPPAAREGGGGPTSLDPLVALVLEVVRRVGDDPYPVRTAVAHELAARPSLVLMAWPELRELGARPSWREPGEISWGLEIVDAALARLRLPASADTRRQVAQGLVDLLPHRAEPRGLV